MKKIFLFLLGALALTSCGFDGSERAEVKDLQSTMLDYGGYYRSMDIVKIEYSGHSYIRFDGGNGGPAVLHDPDCSCHE